MGCNQAVANDSAAVANSDSLEDLFDEALHHQQQYNQISKPRFPVLYFHIGWINLQTYHFSVLHLSKLSSHQPDPSEDLHGVQVLTPWPLEMTGEQTAVYTCTEALLHFLDFHFPWKVSVLQFHCQYGTWCLHGDGSIAVEPIQSVDDFIVWQGSAAEARRRAEGKRSRETRKKTPASRTKRRPQPQAKHSSARRQAEKRRRVSQRGHLDPDAIDDGDADDDTDRLLRLLEEDEAEAFGFEIQHDISYENEDGSSECSNDNNKGDRDTNDGNEAQNIDPLLSIHQ